jgi:uncharacterized protein YbaR (Trm112 family)
VLLSDGVPVLLDTTAAYTAPALVRLFGMVANCRKSCNPRLSVDQTMVSADKADGRLVCAEKRKAQHW